MQEKSYASRTRVENEVLTNAAAASFTMVISRVQRTCSVTGSNRVVELASRFSCFFLDLTDGVLLLFSAFDEEICFVAIILSLSLWKLYD